MEPLERLADVIDCRSSLFDQCHRIIATRWLYLLTVREVDYF